MEITSQGKRVLITGASSGIGLSLAKIFARVGYSLILVSRDKTKLHEVMKELQKETKEKIFVIAKDLSLPDSAQKIFDEVEKLGISINVLVNNAGWGDYGPFAESNRAKQLNMIDLNIRALTELTHVFLPNLQAQKKAYILNVASIAAFTPGPFMSVYFASKAYVLSFGEALAEELRGTNVSVTTLCPGPTATNFLKRTMEESTETFQNEPGMTADEVARVGYQGLMNGRTLVTPGLKNKILTILPRFVPRPIVRRIVRWLVTQ